jgi:serine phosphatase RsbU (regulator of sigma subunit)
LAVFGSLAAGSRVLYQQTEDRLLEQRTSEAAVALQLSVAGLQSALDAAAKLAQATGGDPAAFTSIMAPTIDADGPFTSAALYRIGDPEPIAVTGPPTAIPAAGANSIATVFERAVDHTFVVVDLLRSGDGRRLGYAVPDTAKTPQFVAYAERELNADPNVSRRTDEPFAQLDYAFYLGEHVDNGTLLASSVRDLPMTGRTASQAIPFGDSHLLLVMSPIGHLSSDLFANLWWIVAAIGTIVSAAFGILASRLLERRDTALRLAGDNERLFDEQRQIAETLQLSLLPDTLAVPGGVQAAARYWPAGSANLIGGDFYDLFAADDGRWGVAIGDVCGKGIEAAALTGLARHTLRAAARHGGSPADVLRAVHHALHDHQPPTFCTACFGYLTPSADGSYRLEICLGGHPEPLLRHEDGSVEAVGVRGTLLGMVEPALTVVTTDLQPGDTLVLYTDGLTDAPTDQAVSVEELSELLELQGDEPIEQLADSIRALKRRRRPLGSGDDTAILIVRLDAQNAAGVAQQPTEVVVTASGTSPDFES